MQPLGRKARLGRGKVEFLYGWGKLISVIVFLIVSAGWGVQPAWADPHAVFFTVVGQQQLFFNVLAALNQAAFVEPAKSTLGLPPGNSREELLQKRSQTGIQPETNIQVTSTKTDLASVLVRPITLEGNDLFTAMLAQQFAIEAKRRNDADRIIRLLCQITSGRENCDDGSTNNENADKAYVRDPVQFQRELFTRGVLGVTQSGTAADAAQRRDTLDPNKTKVPRPLAYDSSIAAWEQQTQGTQDQTDNDAKARVLASIENVFVPNKVDASVYNNINKLDNLDSIDDITGALADFTKLPGDVLDAAISGAERIQAIHDIEVNQGARAQTQIVSTGKNPNNLKELATKIDVPVDGTIAAAHTALQTISGNLVADQQYAVPIEATDSSLAQELVTRHPAVKGTTTQASNTGQVLGETDIHEPNQPPASPIPLSTITENPAEEQGPAHFLHWVTDNQFGRVVNGGACGCHVENALNHFGQAILRKINGQ
jgi:hypothetical protein